MSTCIEVSNLEKSFKGRKVVNRLSFEVKIARFQKCKKRNKISFLKKEEKEEKV